MTDDTNDGFGDLVRRIRSHRGLSQFDLAVSADLNRSAVSRIEHNDRNPTRATVIAIADALGVSGALRVRLLSAAGYIERPLTDAQASALSAAWQTTGD